MTAGRNWRSAWLLVASSSSILGTVIDAHFAGFISAYEV
jgi:hypothetical protein